MSDIFDCYYCQKKTKGKEFISWDKTKYFLCSECECASSKSSKKDFVYEENYWHKIIDPDGKERNLLNEKNFKLQNWYGGIINYIDDNFEKGSKVLDIGCGLGHLISSIDNKFNKYALDTSRFSINYINDNYSNINTQCSILKEKLYKENFFDVVVAYHVIEHIDDPFKFIKNIKNILKKGGVLILGTPNRSCIAEKLFKGNFRLYSKEHLLLLTSQRLIQLLKNKGFKVDFIEYPFFKTKYFNFHNIFKLFFTNKISPPFYGSIMTAYAKKI